MAENCINPTRLGIGIVYREINKQGIFYCVKEVSDGSITFDSLSGSVERSGTFNGNEARELAGKLTDIEFNSSEYLAIRDLVNGSRLAKYIERTEAEDSKIHPEIKEHVVKDLQARAEWFKTRMHL